MFRTDVLFFRVRNLYGISHSILAIHYFRINLFTFYEGRGIKLLRNVRCIYFLSTF